MSEPKLKFRSGQNGEGWYVWLDQLDDSNDYLFFVSLLPTVQEIEDEETHTKYKLPLNWIVAGLT